MGSSGDECKSGNGLLDEGRRPEPVPEHFPDSFSGALIESSTRYEIGEKLGAGGMGEVYRGKMLTATGIGKTVALKIIRKDLPPAWYERFVQEATLALRLEHENLLYVMKLDSWAGPQAPGTKEARGAPPASTYFMVMQLIEGATLRALNAAHYCTASMIPVDFCAFIVSRICRGLNYAHALRDPDGRPLGLTHLDISPDNIMMDRQGVCKLTDFGIARAQNSLLPSQRQEIGGKPLFMSPEQMRHFRGEDSPIDHRSDIFSLGLVAYQVLTGLHPFRPREKADSLPELVRHVSESMRHRIVPPHKICREVPEVLGEIVASALERDAADRFESAEAMGLALESGYLYADRYGPTNESLELYLKMVSSKFAEAAEPSLQRRLREQMPFLVDARTGELRLIRKRSYFPDAVEQYRSGRNPCLEER